MILLVTETVAHTPRSPYADDARVTAAMSEDSMRRILAVCIGQARAVRDIEQETALPQATVYRNVRNLVADNMLIIERSAITPDGKRYDLFRSRMRSARLDLDASGVRVRWEPQEAMEERLARVWTTLRGI